MGGELSQLAVVQCRVVRHASGAGRSAVVFGAMGIAGAAIVSDSIHAGCFEHDGPLRALLALLAPGAMAAAGAVIGLLARWKSGPSWAVVSGLVMLMMGSLVGGLVSLVCWPSLAGIVMGARDGVVVGVAALVVSAPVLVVTRRLERVRAGSVAAQSRQIVTWCASGLSMAMGAALAIAVSHPFALCARVPDCSALHVVAVLGALLSLVSAGLSARTVSLGRDLCAFPLEYGPPHEHRVPGPTSVDLGIGEGLWTAPGVEIPYRQVFAPEAQLIGDPLAVLRSFQHDTVQSVLCALGALAMAALSLASTPAQAPLARPVPDGPWYPIPATSATFAGPSPTRVPPASRSRTDEEVIARDIDLGTRRCLGDWQTLNPTLSIGLRIAPSGRVDSVTVPYRSDVSAATSRCIVSVGRQARFAPRAATETIEVVLPYCIP